MEIKLNAWPRTAGEKLEKDFVAAVLYGPEVESKSLKIKRNDLEKTFKAAGESTLINLEIDGGGMVKVLIKDTQYEPLKGTFLHVDFYQVNMKKKITAEVSLEFIGESRAVKELGAMLIKNLHDVEIECLPGDLIGSIAVDISVLREFHDTISISDLKVPSGVKILDEADASVATVVEPKAEAVVAAPVAAEAAPAAGKAAAGAKTAEKAPEKAADKNAKKK
jgi:large subunit ribosomal protein L25